MVSFNVYRSTSSGAYVEGVCLSTDEKPVVGIANGSILFAVDTTSGETTRYMYDQNSMSWIEAACPCGGGSGGSGGGGGEGGEGALILHEVRQDPNAKNMQKNGGNLKIDLGNWLDAKGEDILAALKAGRSIWLEADRSGPLAYCPLSSCEASTTEDSATLIALTFVVDSVERYYSGLSTEYPKKQ